MDSVKIEQLVKDRDFDLRLELLAGENGLDRRIVSSRIRLAKTVDSRLTCHGSRASIPAAVWTAFIVRRVGLPKLAYCRSSGSWL